MCSLVLHVFCSIAIISANGQWQALPIQLKQITASVNYLWGVATDDTIHMCTRPCTNWVQIPGHLRQVDAGDEEVWGVAANEDIYKRPVNGSGDWTKLHGKFTHVSASGNGYVWAVNVNTQIYKCKKPCWGSWERLSTTGLKQLDGGYSYVYGVGRYNMIHPPNRRKRQLATNSQWYFVQARDSIGKG